MTANSAIVSALAERFGTVAELGSYGGYQCFRSELPGDLSWEIRTPIEPAVTEWFKAELSLMDTLRHEHIISVVDAGEVVGTPFYAVEHGKDLLEHLDERGTLQADEVVGLLRDLASALTLCHLHDVVLGDLSPLGVRCYPGRYVLDCFGLPAARSVLPNQQGIVVGNPTYLSPECCRGDALDARSDIYGLGAIAYLCLAGRPAHEGSSALEIMLKKTQAPESLPMSLHRVASKLASLTERMLAPDPLERPQTAKQLLELLSRLAPRG